MKSATAKHRAPSAKVSSKEESEKPTPKPAKKHAKMNAKKKSVKKPEDGAVPREVLYDPNTPVAPPPPDGPVPLADRVNPLDDSDPGPPPPDGALEQSEGYVPPSSEPEH
jgi:hypothetical protein